MIASIDPSISQQPVVNLSFLAKKPHVEFFASKDIYNILIRATSIESNIMESMSILMKSKSHKNVAEIFFTLIINLSYFSPIRSFVVRAPEIRAKPSIFTPDTRFNPSKALSQELSKLSSSKRIKLNYQLSPKQDHKLFDTLSNQIFNETSSSDFDNGSFVASSQVEMITEPPNSSSHSAHRKHPSSAFNDSNAFDYSSNTERIKKSNDNKDGEKIGFNQNQNQQVNSNLNLNPASNKLQVERIKTPETKNSQSMLTDVGKPSVRKPVSWRKGKKPEFMKSDKESDADSKLPSLEDSQSNEITSSISTDNKDNIRQSDKSDKDEKNSNDYEEDKIGKVPELNNPANKPPINLSPIFDILNSNPHLSPRLPHLDHTKISLSVQQQIEKKDDKNIIGNDSDLSKNQNSQKSESKDESDNKKEKTDDENDSIDFSFESEKKDETDNKKDSSSRANTSDKKDGSDIKKNSIDISIGSDKKDNSDDIKDSIYISIASEKKEN